MYEREFEDKLDVQATLTTIEGLRQSGDSDALFHELKRPWPGMDPDMHLAVGELIAETVRKGQVPLFIKNLEYDDKAETVAVEFPDWFVVARLAFGQRYDSDVEADLRFQKSMAVLQDRLITALGMPRAEFGDLVEILQEWLPDWPSHLSSRIH